MDWNSLLCAAVLLAGLLAAVMAVVVAAQGDEP